MGAVREPVCGSVRRVFSVKCVNVLFVDILAVSFHEAVLFVDNVVKLRVLPNFWLKSTSLLSKVFCWVWRCVLTAHHALTCV